MKQTLLLLLAFICINANAAVIAPTISMTTAKAEGETITIFMASEVDNTNIQVDFGDNILQGKTIQSGGTTLSEVIGASQTIKIYGSGIITLSCDDQQITSIDVTNNNQLKNLSCANNQLATLNVTQNTALLNLTCFSNQLTSLNVSNNTALEHLICNSNQLTSLNVSSNTGLTVLDCYGNQLNSLNLTQNTALRNLNCNSNMLTSLDIQQNFMLEQLSCSVNQLTSINLSNNTILQTIMLSSNQISTLDISQNHGLVNLYINNNNLSSLSTSNNSDLYTLSCSNNKITSLNVSGNHLLFGLYCSENKLSTLNVVNNSDLNYLDCSDNLLTTLNVSNNSSLKELYCKGNSLTSLDLSNNTLLTLLSCYNCKFNLATLPIKAAQWTSYFYNPQQDYVISSQTPINTNINLSSQLTVDGHTTNYIWKTEDGTTLSDGVDYTINNGVTSFTSTPTQKVYCEMTNLAFPNLTLKTTLTTITLATGVDNNEMDQVSIYTRQQTVYLNLPQAAMVEVYDITGHKIKDEFMNSGNNSFEMAQKGIYIVKVNINNQWMSQKIVIK